MRRRNMLGKYQGGIRMIGETDSSLSSWGAMTGGHFQRTKGATQKVIG